METHYYKETDISASTRHFNQNRFWADYAVYLSEPPAQRTQPFISNSFIGCTDSVIMILMVISILDLPSSMDNDHEYVPDESRGVTIKAASNALVFKKYL